MRHHIHVATQVDAACNRQALVNGLEALGLIHDEVMGGVEGLPDSNQICHATDLHMTLKVASHEESKIIVGQVDQLMLSTGTVGYYHTERAEDKVLLTHAWPGWTLRSPFPARPFKASYRDTNKEWDLHGSVAEDDLDENFKGYLLDMGMYFIRRQKPDGKIYSIFTIQGISPPTEGRQLFQKLVGWWAACHGPTVSLQWEVTSHMKRYGIPSIVPPTVEAVSWR
jgi:hypothetical protein